ncbi:DNA-methyltransferase [Gimesia aquarii]|uniref:DNA adenine methyltransferase YhdJ n=1 Tax=Gimesia aquarii TaxID=2527964 RepID=A0A517X194_9PLAN|nr:site-specific DNA-methyltransferase [Gimesia aquarii]QDU11276.1 DNA adenine methyltransferase YhdJ [Gimesia aquarii]
MTKWTDKLYLQECNNGLKKYKNKIDLIFADPPYNIGFSYDVYDDNKECSEYLNWSEQWIKSSINALKPTGALWIAIGDEYVAELKMIAQKNGLHLRNWVIWYYTFGVHCNKKFGRSHTHLLYFVKDPNKFTFNDDDIRVPSARQLIYNDKRANSSGKVPDNTWILRPQDASETFNHDQDTWYFARIAGTFKERAGFHGCQMPEQLLGRIIRSCSNPDDVVLDPFSGSGSTLCVAKKLGRRWLGFDISPEYIQLAQARIDSVRSGDPLEGPEDPLKSAPSVAVKKRKNEGINNELIIKAFKKVSKGNSVDKIIADPVLNASFVDECSLLKVRGRPSEWNLTLMGMRKTGHFPEIKATKRVQMPFQKMDPFEYASEIALRRMLDMGYPSLDHILCDPYAASRFDSYARSLAPGFRSFDYRWAALRIRKEARAWKNSSEQLPKNKLRKKINSFDLAEISLKKIPDSPAVYALKRGSDTSLPVYIGETWNLLDRVERTLSTMSALNQFVPNSGDWVLEHYESRNSDHIERRGLQSYLIGQTRPKMNFLELAAL